MDKIAHNFEQSKKEGEEGEEILDSFFEKDFIIEPVSLQTQKKWDIDRKFISKQSKKSNYIEYKTDDVALRTRNIFIEIKSNIGKDVEGWLFKSRAKRVMILVGNIIFSVQLEELKQYILTKGVDYREGTSWNKEEGREYFSLGKLMPRDDLYKLKTLRIYSIEDKELNRKIITRIEKKDNKEKELMNGLREWIKWKTNKGKVEHIQI